jgi:hypothetical protein
MGKVLAALGMVFLLGVDALAPATLPSFDTANWHLAGSNAAGYDASRSVDGSGIATITIKSNANANAQTNGTMAWRMPATKYQGQHISVSGEISTSSATSGQFWMRVDGAGDKPLGFDNMANRALTGDKPWTHFQIVLAVPADAQTIYLGLILVGTGSASARDVRFGTVPSDTPVTNLLPQ